MDFGVCYGVCSLASSAHTSANANMKKTECSKDCGIRGVTWLLGYRKGSAI